MRSGRVSVVKTTDSQPQGPGSNPPAAVLNTDALGQGTSSKLPYPSERTESESSWSSGRLLKTACFLNKQPYTNFQTQIDFKLK